MHIYIVVLKLFSHIIHIYSRHPTPFSCSSSVRCHNHTLLEGRICPPLLKISPILYHEQLITLTSASLNARKRMSTPQVPPVHRLGIPHELRPLARWQNPLEAHCIHVCTKFPLLSTRNGSLQLFDQDAFIVHTLTASKYCAWSPPWQT